MEFNLLPGTEGNQEIVVKLQDCARAFSSGTLDVYATPAMIAMMEKTAMDSVTELLPDGYTTVGSHVNVRHLKPTQPGQKVSFFTKLIMAENRKLTFEVFANDENGLIGTGTHTRYIIDLASFPGGPAGNV